MPDEVGRARHQGDPRRITGGVGRDGRKFWIDERQIWHNNDNDAGRNYDRRAMMTPQ
jgi:hypothetical protein